VNIEKAICCRYDKVPCFTVSPRLRKSSAVRVLAIHGLTRIAELQDESCDNSIEPAVAAAAKRSNLSAAAASTTSGGIKQRRFCTASYRIKSVMRSGPKLLPPTSRRRISCGGQSIC